jgi:hypothetical protein
LSAPATNTDRTLTLPDNSGTLITTASTFAGTGPAFSAYQSTQQTNITTFVQTKVLFQTEEFDTNGNYATGTSRFTPTVAGYYQVSSTVTVASNSNSSFSLTTIYKNGVSLKSGSLSVGISTAFPRSNISALVFMNGSTDYLEAYVFGTDVGGNFATSAQVETTFFQAALVRAA